MMKNKKARMKNKLRMWKKSKKLKSMKMKKIRLKNKTKRNNYDAQSKSSIIYNLNKQSKI